MTEHSDATDDTDNVTGTYYDAGAGGFITVTVTDGRIELYYEDDSPEHTTPIDTYNSVTEFRDEEQELHRISDHVIEDPVSVAENVYSEGFEHALNSDYFSDVAVLWTSKHTEIVTETND